MSVMITPDEQAVLNAMRELDEKAVEPFLVSMLPDCSGSPIRPHGGRYGWNAHRTAPSPMMRLFRPEPTCHPRTAGDLDRAFPGRFHKPRLVRLLIEMSKSGLLERVTTHRMSGSRYSWTRSSYKVYAYKRPDHQPCQKGTR